MPRKIDISQMTTEEIVAYAEKVKQQNRDRVTKYYKNTIKTDPENIKFGFKSVKKQTRDNIVKKTNSMNN
jgi:hypothetical protein